MIGDWAHEVDNGIFALDSSGNVVFWNRYMENLSGHDVNDVVDNTQQQLLDSLFGCHVKDLLMNGGGGGGDEQTIITTQLYPKNDNNGTNIKKSKSLTIKLKVVVEKDQHGDFNGIVCIVQEVIRKDEASNGGTEILETTTTCKIDESNGSAEASSASCYYASVQEEFCQDANISIFGLDQDGTILFWNERMAFLTDCSAEEALGLDFVDTFVMPDDSDQVRQELLLLESDDNDRQLQEVDNLEINLICSKQQQKSIVVNTTVQKDMAGNALGIVCIAHDVTELMEHHRIMAATARELRLLVDTASVPIFGIDLHGNVNEWNDKIAKVTGVASQVAYTQSMVETFIEEESRHVMQKALDQALKGLAVEETKFTLITTSKKKDEDDELRHFVGNISTRRDGNDSIVGVVCVAQDITATLKHQAELESTGQEMKLLIEEANALIFGVDSLGDIKEWNGAMAETLGYSKLEIYDFNMVDMFVHPDYKDIFREYLDNCMCDEIQASIELEVRSRSNGLVQLLVSATQRKDSDGNIVGILCMAQDITDAVQRDGAIASMSHELHHLIDAAHAPIFGIDCEGNVNEWNSLTASMTGYSKEEAFDQPLVETFIADKFQQQVRSVLDSALEGRETTRFELEFVSKSGVTRILLVNATSRMDLDGMIVGAVGVAQDVTDDRKHATELRQLEGLQASQDAKVETERNMTAYFAHELRNPLGAIDCALNAMPDVEEPAKSLISGMKLCTEFMSSIMNNLLDVRKMEEGKMTLHAVAISLSTVLDGVHRMLLPSVRAGVDFLTDCKTTGRDWVLGDAHRIQQVWTNVITNAIKYTVSGSITLSISWEDNCIRFECSDTGPGIPKPEQKKLFERFVQRGGAPGTGLGLAISKHLVDLMDGSIRFESDPTVKPGTSCIVMMPLPECESPGEIYLESGKPIESKLAVLIIDDVKMNRMMLSRRFTKGIAPNAFIRQASTGEEALQICGTNEFDVIIVDQYMEGAGGVMVGTDVVYAMRRMRIESVIIGCSGNDMDEQFLDAGADFVWKKPMPSNAKIITDIRASLLSKQVTP